MNTDIIAGTESGVDTVLVLSGVSDRDTVKAYAYQPTVILDGVGNIIQEQYPVTSWKGNIKNWKDYLS